MKQVFFKTNLQFIDSIPNFFSFLKSQIGEFIIMGTDMARFNPDVIVISFYTDKVKFEEGEPREVELWFKKYQGKITLASIKKINER